MFTIVLILCYFASGVATAVFAEKWGKPPDACPHPGSDDGDICDSIPLTATNALQCVSARHNTVCLYVLWLDQMTEYSLAYMQVFSFVHIGALGAASGMKIFTVHRQHDHEVITDH